MSGKVKAENIRKLKSMFLLVTGGSAAYQFIYFKKDFNGYYKDTLQPLSQAVGPEWAHKLGVIAIKYGIFPPEKYEDPKHLNTQFLNYEISNPIGIAAGFDKHGDAVVGLRNLGFSVIEVGSITPQAQAGNPKPRVFRLPEDEAIINRYGFNSEGHNEVYNKIKDIDKSILANGMLGINLGKNKTSVDALEDYRDGIIKFAHVADYFVINISSPNTPGLRALQHKDELKKLLTGINETRKSLGDKCKAPFLIKLAPDLTEEDQKDIADIIMRKDSKVDGLIISNTTIDRTGLLNQMHANEVGGLSGKPLTKKSTEMIKQMYKLTKGKIPIIGVGGVFDGKDAYEKILAGATVVQIYTALVYEGPGVVTKIKRELAELLQQNGYKSVNDAVGKGL